MVIWMGFKDPRNIPIDLGFIPSFLSEDDPRPAREQFNENYSHGGGWRPMPGFTLNQEDMSLSYDGNPPYEAQAMAKFRDELIVVYDFAFVMIMQPNGSFEVSRMD